MKLWTASTLDFLNIKTWQYTAQCTRTAFKYELDQVVVIVAIVRAIGSAQVHFARVLKIPWGMVISDNN